LDAEGKRIGEKGYNPWRDKGQWKAAGVIAAIGIPAILGWGWYEMAKIDREYAATDQPDAGVVLPSDGETAARPPVYTAGMTSEDINRLTTFAVVLGRAGACGVATSAAADRVGAWMEAKMPPGTPDRATLFPIFMQGVQSHAQQQAAGQSPDNCETVAREFNAMPWP